MKIKGNDLTFGLGIIILQVQGVSRRKSLAGVYIMSLNSFSQENVPYVSPWARRGPHATNSVRLRGLVLQRVNPYGWRSTFVTKIRMQKNIGNLMTPFKPHNIDTHLKGIETSFQVVALF
jgi:hypothetical protein